MPCHYGALRFGIQIRPVQRKHTGFCVCRCACVSACVGGCECACVYLYVCGTCVRVGVVTYVYVSLWVSASACTHVRACAACARVIRKMLLPDDIYVIYRTSNTPTSATEVRFSWTAAVCQWGPKSPARDHHVCRGPLPTRLYTRRSPIWKPLWQWAKRKQKYPLPRTSEPSTINLHEFSQLHFNTCAKLDIVYSKINML